MNPETKVESKTLIQGWYATLSKTLDEDTNAAASEDSQVQPLEVT